ALFEASEHIFWSVDRRIALTSFNQGYLNMVKRLHGTTPQINTDPQTPRQLFAPPEYHAFWKTKYDEVFQGKTVRFETDRTDVTGQRVCNMIYLSPVLNAEGEVEEAFGIGLEVTAERMAETRAREQAAKLNAIFESSAEVLIWSLDKNYRITACNKHFKHVVQQTFGVRPDVGDDLRQVLDGLVPVGNAVRFTRSFDAVLAGKAQHHELCLEMPQGTTWIELYLSPILTDGTVDEVSCLAHDITEKKRAEQEMRGSLRGREGLLKEEHRRGENNRQDSSSGIRLE